MTKKKFGGEKVDVKGVLAPPPAQKAAPGAPAWAKGSGAAAAPPPASSASAGSWGRGAGAAASAPSKAAAKPAGPALGGSWAKGGPQGLAATATSLQAAARQPQQFAPGPRPGAAGPAKTPSLGLKKKDSGQAPPSFSDEAFPEAQRPKDAAELAADKAQAAAVSAFPDSQFASASEALAALCRSAEAAGVASNGGSAVAARFSLILPWLLQKALPEAQPAPRERMLRACALVTDEVAASQEGAAQIRSILEAYFEEQGKKAKPTPQVLEVNGLVDAYLFGGIGRRLAADDPKQASIRMRLIKRLLKAASSLTVQQALADALEPLLALDSAALEEARKTFCEATGADQEAVRRGASLGVLSVVRAAGGAAAVKRLGVLDFVKDAMNTEGKSKAGRRQGGLFTLEALASGLGRTFEPYALSTMPLLLASCSDSSRDVQIAGRAAAQAVVAQVSSNGIRLMVNPLLEGLQDKRWRTQLSALELLKPMIGTLAQQAPKRLAAVLPKAVPLLCEAASGTRADVRDAARAVIQQVGDTVDHPDVKLLAPDLVAALGDPSEGPILRALDTLLGAVFTATLTAAPCALLFPVVQRALASVSAEAKQKAASFVRTLVRLAGDIEELEPYVAQLRPQLKALLADPTPAVREAVAQAIGALSSVVPDGGADGDGEDTGSTTVATTSNDLSASLLEKVNTTKDSVELEGAALGLATAMASLPAERRETLLADLLRPEPKDGRIGRMSVCAHLPKAMVGVPGGEAAVEATLEQLRLALADPDEKARTVARKALSAVVQAVHSESLATPVVAELREALCAGDVRARVAAAELALELVPKLKASWRARPELVVAAIVTQSDDVGDVRRTAERVWRAATESGGPPGKQLLELRPRLLDRLEQDLAGGQDSIAATAGRAAAQLQQRLEANGGVIDDLLPRIVDNLTSGDLSARRSTCVGVGELLPRAEKAQRLLKEVPLTSALRDALLCASSSPDATGLRRAAAVCAAVAPVSSFAGPLLDDLCGESLSSKALVVGPDERRLCLEALCCVEGGPRIAVSSSTAAGSAGLLAAVVAHAADPTCAVDARGACLAAVSCAPCAALRQVATEVGTACVDVVAAGCEEAADAAAAISRTLGAEGSAAFVGSVSAQVEVGAVSRRNQAAACVLASALGAISDAPCDVDALLELSLPGALPASRSAGADATSCAGAFAQVVRALAKACGGPAPLVERGVPRLRELLSSVEAASGPSLPGECFDALLPIAMQGVLGGSAELRAAAAQSEAALLRLAEETAVKDQAVKCAGPLVRALGEKSADVELQVAILEPVEVLLSRAGESLRALVPPLQALLLRLLEQGSAELQPAAARALAALAPRVARPEALVKALCKPPAKAAQFEALESVLLALKPYTVEVLKEARAAIDKASGDKDKVVSDAAARCAAALGA